MSLKRPNFIACILLLLAVFCWPYGQHLVHGQYGGGDTATTATATYETSHDNTTIHSVDSETEHTVTPSAESDVSTTVSVGTTGDTRLPERDSRISRLLGFLLCFAAAIFAGVAILVLWQKTPVLGPDGACALTGIIGLVHTAAVNMDYIMWSATLERLSFWTGIFTGFIGLAVVRELWGWIRARFSLSWCMVLRLSGKSKTPQAALLISAGWVTFSAAAAVYSLNPYRQNLFSVFALCTAAAFGVAGLWRYGADLNHFRVQLDRYQSGLPITVKEGTFGESEAKLLEIQAQHEEAVRTAVTSERFKVELISNVSHDLRTPLTSILGYGELLQRETLSEEGQQQLARLNQKAGYMNDLVESLFELTKVSSGVLESKRDSIDLIRLLEQTVGLFDDQISHAGLTVRRSYDAETLPVITDGARMHQVFANLLGNAIKYALPGTRIYLELKQSEKECTVRMVNTASYEMDFQPEEILQRFARGDKARSTKGSGLGLAIAQTYTESVGGKFRITIDGDQFNAIVTIPKN